jgi:hypothetical protein
MAFAAASCATKLVWSVGIGPTSLMTVPPAAGFFYSGVYCGGSDAGRVFQDFRKSVALAMHAEDVAATLDAAGPAFVLLLHAFRASAAARPATPTSPRRLGPVTAMRACLEVMERTSRCAEGACEYATSDVLISYTS